MQNENICELVRKQIKVYQTVYQTVYPHIPDSFNTYIEPFVGSGALFLYLAPSKWIINDKNKDIINVWNTVRNDLVNMMAQIKRFGRSFVGMDKTQRIELCKRLIPKIPELAYETKRATQFVLMKFCSFMGNIIVRGKFKYLGLETHLYEKDKPVYFFSTKYMKLLKDAHAFLNSSNGKIYNKDYKFILSKAKPGDFVFLDPPYIEEHDYQFNYNVGESLNNDFLYELLEQVKMLDKKDVKWIMTQADTVDVRKCFKQYDIIPFPVTLRPVKNVTSLYRENMYPIDRRHQAQHIYYILQSLRKTALFLQVSHTTISRWIKLPYLCRKTYDSSNRQSTHIESFFNKSLRIRSMPTS